MADDKAISDLIRKRGSIKSRLTIFLKFLDSVPSGGVLSSDDKNEIELRLSKMESLYVEYDDLQVKLECMCDDPDVQYSERELFEKTYYKAIARGHTLVVKPHLHARSDSNSSHCESVVNRNQSRNQAIAEGCGSLPSEKPYKIKLPVISLPTFDGMYNNWLDFRDTFISLIHQNDAIDCIGKFHYLKASLTGSASVLIDSLEFTSDNYYIAWESLLERFDNNRMLISNYVKALFDGKLLRESAKDLRDLIDGYNKILRSLKALGEATQGWDTLLIHMITTRLDTNTLKAWEIHQCSIAKVNYSALVQFLKNRADLLEILETRDKAKVVTQRYTNYNSNAYRTAVVSQTSQGTIIKCVVCNGEHYIYNCAEFLKESSQRRQEIATKLNVCLNCLRTGHNTNDCLRTSCRICNKRHNTLLHPNDQRAEANHTTVALPISTSRRVLLSTATIKVFDHFGNVHHIRALLDSASDSNFITERLSKILQCDLKATGVSITGFNKMESSVVNQCNLRIQSVSVTYETNINCYVTPNITSPLPAHQMFINELELPHGVYLADPDFYEAGEVDLLIGAELFWNILLPGRIRLGKNKPSLQETKLGWILFGCIHQSPQVRCNVAISTISIQDQLTKFWEIEEVENIKQWSEDDYICEKIFKETHERLPNGRFIVQIPLKQDANILGDSFQSAQRRFLSLERKLQQDTMLSSGYNEFIDEYEKLSHMTKVTNNDNNVNAYYLPHHAIVKEDRTTTKLRVVFDASAKTSNGVSFNDIQYVGPTIQDDILSILLRFRQHAIVVSADIAKMYRQILIKENQRSLQRILWRNSKTEPISIFQLNTVTYGTASAPFLAIRCLKQLADECEEQSIATIIEHDFYVDDLLSGADTVEEATRICQRVNQQLNQGCYNLRKWKSNNEAVLKNLTEIAISGDHTFNESPTSKTLGLMWNSESDNLCYKIQTSPEVSITKRNILATISQIFDPLGLVSPTVIEAKVLLQKLWLQKLSWDENVPKSIELLWKDIMQVLFHLNYLKIPRHVFTSVQCYTEIHIFSDASETAYGACAYVRSIDDRDTVHSRLLCSKAKVAPLKSTTMPRLELCGALVASRLYQKIQRSLRLEIGRYMFWCDSSIVIGWLRTQSCLLNTFVRNRVAKVQEATASHTWRYVPSELNPADILSRGARADSMAQNTLWWQGPSFLKFDEKQWPDHEFINSVELPEQRVLTVTATTKYMGNSSIDTILTRCSTLTKTTRVMAYILRFVSNCKKYLQNGPLSCKELDTAMGLIIKYTQMKHFKTDIDTLQSDMEHFPTKGVLTGLHPFICKDGFLRIRGRLGLSYISYNAKHPIILPKEDILTKRIFEDQHLRSMHAGPQLLLATVRQRYWPIGGRNLARSIVHNCVRCTRMTARALCPLMGDLPSSRVSQAQPFDVTGVDYAGPVMISTKKGRGAKLIKSYICLFVCFATKAIHLELATDMSTESFLLALKRFIARRGKPSHIHCDNGSNFVGGWNDIKSLISDTFSKDSIQFHFIPPHAPHFGGLWEAGVKSTKHHLKRVLGLAHLTYEELLTTLCQIEAILNSRPLTPLSSSPIDSQALTPGHFLIGRPLTSLPESPCNGDIHHIPRYQRVEQLKQHFWKRWHIEYISQLQERTKWKEYRKPIAVGTMVVIKDDDAPPLKWRLGRVMATHAGQDGVVRVVTIQSATGSLRRPVSKICALPIET